MSKKQTIHVVPTKDGKWANKKPNSKRASSYIILNQNLEVKQFNKLETGKYRSKIHGKNGRIRESNTYYKSKNPR